MRSARNLVRDVSGKHNSEAEVGLGETTPISKVDVATVATRLFALLFLVKGIECCATSKSQGDHALDEVCTSTPFLFPLVALSQMPLLKLLPRL